MLGWLSSKARESTTKSLMMVPCVAKKYGEYILSYVREQAFFFFAYMIEKESKRQKGYRTKRTSDHRACMRSFYR